MMRPVQSGEWITEISSRIESGWRNSSLSVIVQLPPSVHCIAGNELLDRNMDLTNEQARVLFDAGCFIVLTGLPEGSEVGIDGT